MGCVFVNGKYYPDVRFVSDANDADFEVIYDAMQYNRDAGIWEYLYHGRLVAVASVPVLAKGD